MSAAIAQFRHAAFTASKVARTPPGGKRKALNIEWKRILAMFRGRVRHTNSGGQL
jgi:hypothetical protein